MKFVGLLIVSQFLLCSFNVCYVRENYIGSRKVFSCCATLDVVPEGLVSPEGQLHVRTNN